MIGPASYVGGKSRLNFFSKRLGVWKKTKLLDFKSKKYKTINQIMFCNFVKKEA